MCYKVIPTKKFKSDLKYYIKKKNYYKLKDDIIDLTKKLEDGQLLGDEISNLGFIDESVYKVRMVNSTANIGASGGFRVIYYVIKDDKEIYYLTIYSKKDKENITNSDIKELIKEYVSMSG